MRHFTQKLFWQIPLEEAVPEPMTTEELQSRRGAIVRQHLRLQGKSDEEIDMYLSQPKHD